MSDVTDLTVIDELVDVTNVTVTADATIIGPTSDATVVVESGRAGPPGHGTGLPAGGTVGQTVVNTSPGHGAWGNLGATHVNYTPTAPGDWNGVPDDAAEALDLAVGRLVADETAITNLQTDSLVGLIRNTHVYTVADDGATVDYGGKSTPVDLSGGSFGLVLPNAALPNTLILPYIKTAGGTLTLTCATGAHIGTTTGPTTLTLSNAAESVLLNFDAGNLVWHILAHSGNIDPTAFDTAGSAAAASSAAAAAQATANAAIPLTQKGAASGVPTLDGTVKVPLAQVPTGTTSSTVALGDAPAAAQANAISTAATDATNKANAAQAAAIQRANHTGTQLLATISDAGTAAAKNLDAANQVPTLDSAGLLRQVRHGLFYNVKQALGPTGNTWGVTGDGVTDDRVAINQAITDVSDAGGGTIYFPPGTYMVGNSGAGRIVLKSNVTLRGASPNATTIKAAASAGAHTINASSSTNMGVENLTIDSNARNSGQTAGHGLLFASCTYSHVNNVRSINSADYAFSFQDCTDFIVTNIIATDCGSLGVDFHNITNGTARNILHNCTVARWNARNIVTPMAVNIRGAGTKVSNVHIEELGYYADGTRQHVGFQIRFGETHDTTGGNGGEGGQWTVVSNVVVTGTRGQGLDSTHGNEHYQFGNGGVGFYIEAHDCQLTNCQTRNVPIGFQLIQGDCLLTNCRVSDAAIEGFYTQAFTASVSLPKGNVGRNTFVGCSVTADEVWTGTISSKPGASQATLPVLTSLLLNGFAPATFTPNTNYFSDMSIEITGGTGVGTSANVKTYNASTRTLTLDANLTVDNTSTFLMAYRGSGWLLDTPYNNMAGCRCHGAGFTLGLQWGVITSNAGGTFNSWVNGYIIGMANQQVGAGANNNIVVSSELGAYQRAVSGGLLNTDISGLGTLAALSTITTGEITDGTIVNGDISGSAAIALSKLAAQAANTVTANATGSSAVPTAVAMGASTMLARLAAGNVVAATPAQIKTLLAIANTDVSGLGTLSTLSAVASANITDGTIVAADLSASAAVALSQLATQADQTIVGNTAGSTAVPTALTASQARVVLKEGSTVKVGTTVNSNNGTLVTMLPSTFSLPASPVVGDITRFTGLISAVAGGGTGTFSYQITVAGTAVLATSTTSSVSSGLTILGEMDFSVGVLTLGSGTSGKLNIWGHILWNNGDRMYVMSENLGVNTTATIAVDIKASASVNNAFTATVSKQFWMVAQGGV